MKLSIIILFVLGIIAAACAAVLMGIWNIGTLASGQTQSEDVTVAMANVSLPAMTVITHEHIDTEIVSRNELPKGTLVNSTGVIARVLAVPVFSGQILTESCFVAEGSGAHLAAQIPHGMRAVTVPVSSKTMPDRSLLYPGCVVDVVAVYRLSGQDSVSTTMLRGIQVIAVDNETIVSNHENEEEDEKKTKRSSRGSSVTLLVDTKQAEGLQLAVENGIISLSVRNPLDKNEFEMEGTILNPDRLAELGDMLEPTVLSALGNESNLLMEKPDRPGQVVTSNNQQQQGEDTAATGTDALPQQRNQTSKQRKSLRWSVEQIRGPKTDVKEFEAEEGEPGKITPKK